MLGAAALLGSLSLAFVLGGKKAPPARDLETYIEIGRLDGSSIDLNTQATPDNWVENTVPAAEVAAAAPATDPTSTQRSSALIQGDGTGAQTQPSVAQAPATPAPGQAATTPAVASTPPMPVAAEPHAAAVDAANVPGTGTQAAPRPAITTTGSVQVAQATPKSGPPGGSDKAGTATTNPATTNTGSDKAATATTTPASAPVTPQPQASSPAAPHAIPVKVARVVAEEHASPTPAFVRPAQKRSGVVAQTRTLITEKQYAPPSAAKAARPAGEEKTTATGSTPARVRQQEARSYAQQATRQLREQKALPPNLQVRLPRRAETTNPAVWHEDDTPATADERRPFGLVVVEEKPDLTPEGIPLRTDVPAGTSPLQQNGADKPLWKRPE